MSSPADRRWLEVSARCPTAGDRSALLAEGLLALGARAVEERAGWYVTALDDPGDEGAFDERAREVLCAVTGLSGIEIRLAWRPHEEWAETWKRGLDVRRITDRIVVRPSWIEYEPSTGEEVIVVDPGMAFGTAEHGTTRGCLRLLDRVVSAGDSVLDVGAGSGILAVAAARLGAHDVVAVEGDVLALEALVDNVERNGVTERVRVVDAWADAASLAAWGPVNGVLANLEWGILLPLLGGLVSAVVPDGWLVVSGIREEEWTEVQAAVGELGWGADEVDRDEGWVSALVRRAPRPPG